MVGACQRSLPYLARPLASFLLYVRTGYVDLQTETNTAMSPAFLMQQMAWREQLDDARAQRESAAFDALDADLRDAQAALARDIGESIDARHDFDQAGQRVREWMFIQRIAQSLYEHRPQ